MHEYCEQWTIQEMARVLDVSRSGYYAFMRAKLGKRKQENEVLTSVIRNIFTKSRETYGSPRIQKELEAQGYRCSRPRVARLMKLAGIKAKMRRSYKTTTRVDTRREAAPNLLNQDFSASSPNEKWVADISYISTQEGWLYIALVLDLFSRKIVGISMGESLETKLVSRALEQALRRRNPESGLVHHSDKGCQYTSAPFQALLAENEITCSMSGTGNCYDNAVMESFFHTLKTELVYCEHYASRHQAKQSIFEYIEIFYNNERRHSSLDYLSPAEFEKRHCQQPSVFCV
jgi:putative transposase